MAREFENLEILISVINQAALEDLNDLILKLGELESVAEAVDTINIKVDVHDRQLDSLQARLAAMKAGETLDVDTSAVGGSDAANLGAVGIKQRGVLIGLATTRNQLLVQLLASQQLAARNIKQGAGNVDVKKLLSDMGAGGVGGRKPQRGDKGFNEPSFLDREGAGLLNIRMRDFHNALAKLMPFIFVLIGALPALITAIVGLAAAAVSATIALSALAGVGMLGLAAARGDGDVGAGFEDIMGQIRDDLMDAFMPLAERLAPLMERALGGLDYMFEQLARSMYGLLDIQDIAVDFGQWLTRYLPAAMSNMIEATQTFDRIFESIGQFLEQTSLLGALSRTFAEMAPALYTLTNQFIAALPVILQFSTGFMDVLGVFFSFLGVIGHLISMIPVGSQAFGRFIATGLTLISVLSVLNFILQASLLKNLWAYIAAKQAELGAYISNITLSKAYFMSLLSEVAAKIKAIAVTFVLVSVLTLGIGAIVGLTSGLLASSQAAAEATRSLSDFNSEMGNVSGSPYRGPSDAPDAPTSSAMDRAQGASSGSITNNFNGDQDPEDFDTKMNNTLFRL